jgi:hypothetical protein
MNFPLLTLLEREFADIVKKKNRWMDSLERGDLADIKDNLYVLIDNSYVPLGGHPRIPNPAAVLDPKTNYWAAADVDKDPQADSVIFGSKRFGIKIAGIGHDGAGGKKTVIQHLVKLLDRPGYWVEASDRLGEILAGKNTPYLKNQKDVEKIFGSVDWKEDGWYTRSLGGGKKTSVERVFGKPKL